LLTAKLACTAAFQNNRLTIQDAVSDCFICHRLPNTIVYGKASSASTGAVKGVKHPLRTLALTFRTIIRRNCAASTWYTGRLSGMIVEGITGALGARFDR
jgi:hypothetical protein